MSLSDIHRPQIDLANPAPAGAALPESVLYSSAARFGGTGLDSSSLQGALAPYRGNFLGQAIGYGNNQAEIAPSLIRSLRFHPVRLLSGLPSHQYYGAKKRYVDWLASRELKSGRYDLFHGWSGDAERSLIVARERGIPSMIEIPTWHRNKFAEKPFETRRDIDIRKEPGIRGILSRLEIDRPRMLLEYELTDLVLVQSECAAESFLAAGLDPRKIFYVSRGVDPDQYTVATPPPLFRLTFVGALIKRKGIHCLLEAWHKLALKDAELVLIGSVHEEMRPYLDRYKTDSVTLTGFVPDVPRRLGQSSAFVFPSECEGTAKATLEGIACGLPIIATREAGDAVADNLNGLVVPPNDADALADAIRHLYDHPEKLPDMGRASRDRVLNHFTWEHYRARLLHAYAYLHNR